MLSRNAGEAAPRHPSSFRPNHNRTFAAGFALAIAAACLGLQCKTPVVSTGPVSSSAEGGPGPLVPALNDGAAVYSKDYTFSEDWFSDRVPLWSQFVGPLRGKPELAYLEIGVFEGRSALWMLENILTHPSARLTAIDIFLGNTKAVYLSNLSKSGLAHKATTIQGQSGIELRKLPLASFDVIYIDGSHTADDVLADAVLSWGLLRDGGLMIFDDYAWTGRLNVGEPATPDELRPGVAIDAFITAYRNYLDVIHREWQVIVRKHGGICAFKEACTPIGDFDYRWWAGQLFRRADNSQVPLTDQERALLERLLKSRGFGKSQFEPDAKLRAEPGFDALVQKLGVRL